MTKPNAKRNGCLLQLQAYLIDGKSDFLVFLCGLGAGEEWTCKYCLSWVYPTEPGCRCSMNDGGTCTCLAACVDVMRKAKFMMAEEHKRLDALYE